MKKLFIFVLLSLLTINLHAANPAYENFDPVYFTRIGNVLTFNLGTIPGGSASNVFFLDSSSINWTKVGVSNVASLATAVSNEWRNYTLSASNSITANFTNYVIGVSNGLVTLINAGGVSGFATNGYGTFGGNAGGFTNVPATPPQMPSTIWNSWSSPVLLLTNGNSIQDSNHLAEATIGNIGTTMALYYTSYDGGSTGRIWSAYGSLKDGFVKHGITLAPTPGAWDGSSIGGATHYRENGTNYLFYFGGTNFSPGSFELDPLHIGVAYSTDGTNYTKAANPILRTTDVVNSTTLYIFFCKKVGTNYLGYFNAKYASGAQERINLATAPSPLGPWAYYGQIYHHTNATITSDFTVQDLPSGGYIAAYWIETNGTFEAACAYSDNLINWRYAGTLGGDGPGTRLFYDDGIALSYTANQTSVYYVRPNRASLGRVLAESVIASSFTGNGSGLSNVNASTALNLSSRYGTAGQPVLGGTFDGTNNYWVTWGGSDPLPNNNYSLGYSIDLDHWFTRGGFQFGDFISLTNHTGGSNTVMLSHLGSRINGVGFTNNTLYGSGRGLTNIHGTNIFVNASGFDGNLTTGDTNLQQIAQKLDDLVAVGSGGSGGTSTVWSVVVATNYTTPVYYDDGEISGTGVLRFSYTAPATALYRLDFSDVFKLESGDPHDSTIESFVQWTDERGVSVKSVYSTDVPDQTGSFWKFGSGAFDFHALAGSTILVSNRHALSWQSGDALSTNYLHFVLSRRDTITNGSGSGTPVTFNSTQFGSSSAGTNLLSGVLLTNAVNRIADETVFLTDSDGAGNPLLSWDSDNGDIHVYANLVVRDGIYGHGANITNINAANITGNLNIDTLTVSTQIVTQALIGNGGNLTNLNASELSSGTVPLARLAGVMTNNNVNRFVIFTNNLYALYVETNGTVFYTNYSASSQGVSITSNGTVYVGGNLHLAGGTVSAPTVIRFDIAGANGITRFSGTGLGVGGANQANSSGTAFTAYGIGTFSSYAMATNGYAFIDASTFPTSSIPAGSATRTNFSMIAYKGFPRTVATNIATGGWMEFTNGNWFPFTP